MYFLPFPLFEDGKGALSQHYYQGSNQNQTHYTFE